MAILSAEERRRNYNRSLDSRFRNLTPTNYVGSGNREYATELGVTDSSSLPLRAPVTAGNNIPVTTASNVIPSTSTASTIASNANTQGNQINNARLANQVTTTPQLLANTGANSGQNQYTNNTNNSLAVPNEPFTAYQPEPQEQISSTPQRALPALLSSQPQRGVSVADTYRSNQQETLSNPNSYVNMDTYNNRTQAILNRAEGGLNRTGVQQIERFDNEIQRARNDYDSAEATFNAGGDFLGVISARRRMRLNGDRLNQLEGLRADLNKQENAQYSQSFNDTTKNFMEANNQADRFNAGFNQQIGMQTLRNLNQDAATEQELINSQIKARQDQALRQSDPEYQLRLQDRQLSMEDSLVRREAEALARQNPSAENLYSAALAGSSGAMNALNYQANQDQKDIARQQRAIDKFDKELTSLTNIPNIPATPSKGSFSDGTSFDTTKMDEKAEQIQGQLNTLAKSKLQPSDSGYAAERKKGLELMDQKQKIEDNRLKIQEEHYSRLGLSKDSVAQTLSNLDNLSKQATTPGQLYRIQQAQARLANLYPTKKEENKTK